MTYTKMFINIVNIFINSYKNSNCWEYVCLIDAVAALYYVIYNKSQQGIKAAV